jgi:hypothetical protein
MTAREIAEKHSTASIGEYLSRKFGIADWVIDAIEEGMCQERENLARYFETHPHAPMSGKEMAAVIRMMLVK